MAVTLTHRWIKAQKTGHEWLEYRINGNLDGYSLPEKIGTVSASQIAEGFDIAGLFEKERTAGETRLNTLIAARRALEDI